MKKRDSVRKFACCKFSCVVTIPSNSKDINRIAVSSSPSAHLLVKNIVPHTVKIRLKKVNPWCCLLCVTSFVKVKETTFKISQHLKVWCPPRPLLSLLLCQMWSIPSQKENISSRIGVQQIAAIQALPSCKYSALVSEALRAEKEICSAMHAGE